MSILARLLGRGARGRAVEAKASRTGAWIALQGAGRPVWTPRDYAALAREGYQGNAVVHRCVRMVAEAAASVTLLAYEGEREASEHELLALLARPNPRDGGAALLEAVYGHLLVAGNAYVEAVSVDGAPRELYALRPDRMTVVPGPDGWAEAWEYGGGGRAVRFVRPAEGLSPILHLTLFNPLDDHYGLSPMEAAATALDIHNAAGAWNKALLDNAARPSGALVYAGPAGGNLNDEQFARLKDELAAGFQGAANAGRPLLLEGGLDWKPLSLTPKDMDFVEAKAAAAREIALAFGVPPMLLGLPGDNTYANYAEAHRAFWRQTVLPLVGRTAQSLAQWLGPAFGTAVRLEPDLDRIEALSTEREALWARVGAAGFLSDDEKRLAVGYGPRDAQELKFNPSQPRTPAGNGRESGRWTGEAGGAAPISPAASAPERPAAGGSSVPSVNLATEDDAGYGAHNSKHVGRSEQELIETLRPQVWWGPAVNGYQKAEGSFDSWISANDHVNQALRKVPELVERVSSGKIDETVINVRLGYRTGVEAFRSDEYEEPRIRPTYGLRIVLRHRPELSKGFQVQTSFPINESVKGWDWKP